MKKEERLQTQIATYLKLQYPDVIFTSESSGLRVGIGLAMQMKRQRSKHKLPDLLILHPNKKYKGLFLELKKDLSEAYLKNGQLREKKHIQEQNKTLQKLNKLGYYACFSCGFSETKNIIDKYFSNKIL